MSTQTKVNIYQSVAVAGDRASLNPVIYTPQNYLAGDGGVYVGGFVWEAGDETNPSGVVSYGTGTPLGFVERTLSNFSYNTAEDGTLQIVEGGLVPVAVFGDFWVEAPEAVSKGAAVYADTATGAISFSSGAPTPYVTVSAADAGELVVISAWSGIVSGLSGSVSSGSGGSSSSVDLSGYMKTDFSNASGTLSVENGGTGAATAIAARTALGLGALATANSVDLASDVTGTLPVANGGTGLTALGTSGQVLSTNSEATAMEWANVSTESADLSNYMTVDFANVTGTLDIAHGGTGLSSIGNDGEVLTSTGSALAYETPASADLSDYVKTEDLAGYATTADLSDYATTASVTSTLAGYVTTSSLSSALEGYATTASLSGYVTSDSLNSTLSSYATTASLSDYATTASLSDYATTASVTSTLADYAKTSDLSSYATTESLSAYATTDSLGDYATIESLSAYATTASLSDYVTSNSLTSTLSGYAQTSSLGDLATKSQVDLTSDVTGILPTSNGGTGNATGNADTATKLATSQTISLSGAVTGSGSFDGSTSVDIVTTLASE